MLNTVKYLNKLDIDLANLPDLVSTSIDAILELYPELEAKKQEITDVIVLEKDKFVKTLINGEREFDKVAQRAKAQGKDVIETEAVFKLFETYGFPPEMTEELAHEQGLKVDMSDYQRLFKER